MDRNKPVVMVLHGSASTGPTPYDGQYLKSFDFEAFAGQGEIVMTPDINEAKVFPDHDPRFRVLSALAQVQAVAR